MPTYLGKYLNGMTEMEFFERFGLDPIRWFMAFKADEKRGWHPDSGQPELAPAGAARIVSDTWRILEEEVPGQKFRTVRYRFQNPRKDLTMVLQFSEHTP